MQAVDAQPTRTAAHRWTSGWRLVLLVIVVATITHLPGLVRTEVLNPDEAFLATQAQVINDGGDLYQDAVDRKPPLVPYLYAAAFRVTGSDDLISVRLLVIAAHVATALLLAAIARRRWGSEAAFAAGVLYLVASAGLVLEDGQAANFEVFMLPLMCASMLLADRGRGAASGVVVGFATLAKQVGAATLLPLAYLAWTRARLRGLALLGLGFGATILVAAALFGWSEFFFWVFTDTGGYLDASDSLSLAFQRGAGGFGVFLGANLGALLLIVFAVRRQRENLDLWLWVASAIVAVAAGFRFFGHYFLQLAPPFALLAAGALPQAARWLRATTATLAVASVAVFTTMALLWNPNVLHRYDHISAAIEARTSANDRVFVWGHFPQLYWASDRRPATRFLTSGFLTGFSGGRATQHVGREYAVDGAWDDFKADLAQHPPALIVDASVGTSYPIARFPELASFLAEGYVPVEEVDGTVLYVRR